MDILTPHEGITNEKICETQIEMLERKQNEYKLIGKITAVPGHTLFKLNTETRVASKATIKAEFHTIFNPKTGTLDVVKIDALRNKYDIMKFNQHGWWQKAPGGGWCAPKYTPIGWRHIHEL